jgi:hypothetical protein
MILRHFGLINFFVGFFSSVQLCRPDG